MLGIEAVFDSAHHLPGTGACARLHGHTYKVQAVLDLPPGSQPELSRLQARLEALLQSYDHADLNARLEFPTCENLCRALFRHLQSGLEGLRTLEVWEGEGKSALVESSAFFSPG